MKDGDSKEKTKRLEIVIPSDMTERWFDKQLALVGVEQGYLSFETQSAKDFAILAVRTAFLLNGGGLLALPAFQAMFSSLGLVPGNALFVSAAAYFLGLASVSVACWFSFQNYEFGGESAADHFAAERYDVTLTLMKNGDGPAGEFIREAIAGHQKSSEKLDERVEKAHKRAVGFVIAGFGFFGVGCLPMLWVSIV